jgi:Flp pilus assembly protein TadG
MSANRKALAGVGQVRSDHFERESGQSLLEVALLLPILVAMLLGVIELGRYAYISILVGNAARAGAAYGAQSLVQSIDAAGIQTAADNDFQNNGQNVATLTVTSSTTCACDNGTGASVTAQTACSALANRQAGSCNPVPGSQWVVMVSVTASGTFNSLFNYPGIPSTLTVSSTSTLRVPQI